MNYVEVQPRGWKINDPLVDRDDEWKEIVDASDEDDEIFDK